MAVLKMNYGIEPRAARSRDFDGVKKAPDMATEIVVFRPRFTGTIPVQNVIYGYLLQASR